MKKLILALIVLISFGGIIVLSGCMTLPLSRQEHETWTFNIKVTSEPSGADIYLDNMLIGRTPAEPLPIGIPTTCTLSLMPIRYEPQGQHYLRLSKEGYRDAVEPIEFEQVAQPGVSYKYQLKKAEYHFVLEKKSEAIDMRNISLLFKEYLFYGGRRW